MGKFVLGALMLLSSIGCSSQSNHELGRWDCQETGFVKTELLRVPGEKLELTWTSQGEGWARVVVFDGKQDLCAVNASMNGSQVVPVAPGELHLTITTMDCPGFSLAVSPSE